EEIPSRGEVDVADAASRLGAGRARRAMRLDERHEHRDLSVAKHSRRAEDVLLEIDLARAGRVRRIVPSTIERAERHRAAGNRADEEVLVERETAGRQRTRARATRLRARDGGHEARRRDDERELKEP